MSADPPRCNFPDCEEDAVAGYCQQHDEYFDSLKKFEQMWIEQIEWLRRLKQFGQRHKANAALFNMEDIEKRYFSPTPERKERE